MAKKVLVTGGAGFIGSFIVDRLIQDGHEVRVFDNLEHQVHKGKVPGYLNKKAEFSCGDVRNYEEMKEAMEGVDIVLHEASMVGVGQSQYQPKKYVDVNSGGTANLMDLLVNSEHDVQKLIVAGSMSSYGEGYYTCDKCGLFEPELRTEEQLANKDFEIHCPTCAAVAKPVPTNEYKRQAASSIYAITKKNQEEMCLSIGKSYGIPTVSLRYFNVYGPRQSLSNPYTGVAAIFLSRIKNNNPPLIFEDGMQSRDFVSVHDVVEANMLAMKSSAGDYEAFNVGTGRPISILDVARILIALQGAKVEPKITGEFRKGDIKHCYADITKINQKLGFKPLITFEEGMKELISWSAGVMAEDEVEKATQEMREKGLIK